MPECAGACGEHVAREGAVCARCGERAADAARDLGLRGARLTGRVLLALRHALAEATPADAGALPWDANWTTTDRLPRRGRSNRKAA
jgi:hypothetical protein